MIVFRKCFQTRDETWPLNVVWLNPGAKSILPSRSPEKGPDHKRGNWTKLHAPKPLKENMLGQTSPDFRARGVTKRPAQARSGKSYALMKRHGNILRLTLSLPKEFLRAQLAWEAWPCLIFSDLLATLITQLPQKSRYGSDYELIKEKFFFNFSNFLESKNVQISFKAFFSYIRDHFSLPRNSF